jgi:hypothetical protein
VNATFVAVVGEAWGSLGERRFLFLTLIGFVCAFGFIRLSTRLMRSPRVPWWPGSVVSDDGVHVHHLFFGIVLMMVAGGLSFAAGETDGPWYAIYGVLFGIGIGLTIDEYALWLHLDDVYWAREGRSSIDAALIRRPAARQAALDLGQALLRGAPPSQAGAGRAALPGRPHDRPLEGAAARRDRRGHGGGVPGAPCRIRAVAGGSAFGEVTTVSR